MVKVCVIGAGVNGLTCALKIKEKHRDFDVNIKKNVMANEREFSFSCVCDLYWLVSGDNIFGWIHSEHNRRWFGWIMVSISLWKYTPREANVRIHLDLAV